MMNPKQALVEAIRRAGSRYALARLLGITYQSVYGWGKTAPPGRARAIERVTGVSADELAPVFLPEVKKAS